jgi:hypothetical protein
VCIALADYGEKKLLLSPLAGLTLQLTRNTRQFFVNVYFTILRALDCGRDIAWTSIRIQQDSYRLHSQDVR